MITTFEDFNQDPAILNIDNEQESIIQEYLESFRPKICCLESYWGKGMTDVFSIKPFVKSIGWLLEKDIVFVHRMISSGLDLAHYVKYPEGIIWQDPNLAGIDCFYLASHGKPGGLLTSVKAVESEELIAVFNGLNRYNNFVFFAACEVFAGEQGKRFAQEFLRRAGTVAVVGYSAQTSFIDGLVIDTLFLARFFETEGNKFDQLQYMYEGVLQDYPRAKECGFSLYINKEYRNKNFPM
jgi:hypothetical protein